MVTNKPTSKLFFKQFFYYFHFNDLISASLNTEFTLIRVNNFSYKVSSSHYNKPAPDTEYVLESKAIKLVVFGTISSLVNTFEPEIF